MQENNSVFSYEDKLDIYSYLFLKYSGLYLYDKRFSLTDIYKTLDSYNIFSRKMFKQNLDIFHSLINFPNTVESKNFFQSAVHKRILDLSRYLFKVGILDKTNQTERKFYDITDSYSSHNMRIMYSFKSISRELAPLFVGIVASLKKANNYANFKETTLQITKEFAIKIFSSYRSEDVSLKLFFYERCIEHIFPDSLLEVCSEMERIKKYKYFIRADLLGLSEICHEISSYTFFTSSHQNGFFIYVNTVLASTYTKSKIILPESNTKDDFRKINICTYIKELYNTEHQKLRIEENNALQDTEIQLYEKQQLTPDHLKNLILRTKSLQNCDIK